MTIEQQFKAELKQLRRSMALDAGLRVNYETGGIFVKMKSSGDYSLLHDYLKSCIRHGKFDQARATVRQYADLKKKGHL